MEVALGKILFYRSIDASGAIDLSPDGTKLLVQGGSKVEVLDMATGESLKEIVVEGGSANTFWAGNDHILVGGTDLLDVEREFVCWHYRGQKATYSAGGKIWFLAGDDNLSVLRAEKLPHKAALDRIKEAEQDSDFFALQPGSTVNVDVKIPSDPTIQEKLIAKLEGAGFKYDPAAPVTFVAKVTVGKSEEVTYREGFGGFGEGTKYNFTPSRTSLELVQGDAVLWGRSAGGYSPHIISLQNGETVATALQRYEKPDLGIYERVVLPKFIVRPGKAGESSITVNSLN